MKIVIVNDEGEIVAEIENIEEYDLSKAVARADIIQQIEAALETSNLDQTD